MRGTEVIGISTGSPKEIVNAALREVVRARMVGMYVQYLKNVGPEPADAAREAAWR